MEFSRWIFDHWQRKLVAFVTALIIWLFVNHSIIDTKTISNIAVKVVNLPADRAILGQLPNGLLSRRITLTLSGTKRVIADLEAGDIEVVLDASSIVDREEWPVSINKKNLVSLNPAINLASHITLVEHGDFVIRLSKLVTLQIPITLLPPTGAPPPGYLFVDQWPKHLEQTISGPEEELARVAESGLQLQFNLDKVTKGELEQLKSDGDQELLLSVPAKWKKISIPCECGVDETLLEGKLLQLAFLKEQWLSVEASIPIQVYYPFEGRSHLNPESHPLADGGKVIVDHGIRALSTPLYVQGVSRLFLEVVKNYLGIAVVASIQETNPTLTWSFEVVDSKRLENRYVALSLKEQGIQPDSDKEYEQLLRSRFQTYLRRLALYEHPEQKLYLDCVIENDKIIVR